MDTTAICPAIGRGKLRFGARRNRRNSPPEKPDFQPLLEKCMRMGPPNPSPPSHPLQAYITGRMAGRHEQVRSTCALAASGVCSPTRPYAVQWVFLAMEASGPRSLLRRT